MYKNNFVAKYHHFKYANMLILKQCTNDKHNLREKQDSVSWRITGNFDPVLCLETGLLVLFKQQIMIAYPSIYT